MDEYGGHDAKLNKLVTEGQTLTHLTYVMSLVILKEAENGMVFARETANHHSTFQLL